MKYTAPGVTATAVTYDEYKNGLLSKAANLDQKKTGTSTSNTTMSTNQDINGCY